MNRWPWAQALFGLLLLMSLALLGWAVMVEGVAQPPGPNLPTPPGDAENRVPAAASLLTAVASCVGVIVTSILGWRRDRREVQAVTLELQRQELEIKKLKHELARLELETRLSDPGPGE